MSEVGAPQQVGAPPTENPGSATELTIITLSLIEVICVVDSGNLFLWNNCEHCDVRDGS